MASFLTGPRRVIAGLVVMGVAVVSGYYAYQTNMLGMIQPIAFAMGTALGLVFGGGGVLILTGLARIWRSHAGRSTSPGE